MLLSVVVFVVGVIFVVVVDIDCCCCCWSCLLLLVGTSVTPYVMCVGDVDEIVECADIVL